MRRFGQKVVLMKFALTCGGPTPESSMGYSLGLLLCSYCRITGYQYVQALREPIDMTD
jgi:hypothetical protein